MINDFLASIERPRRALAYRRARRKHAALAPAAERFAPVTRHHPAPFTCGEARYLNELEDWLAGHKHEDDVRRNGTWLADYLRACIPEATDVGLTKVTLAMTKASEAYAGYPGHFRDALGAAALELADVERALA